MNVTETAEKDGCDGCCHLVNGACNFGWELVRCRYYEGEHRGRV